MRPDRTLARGRVLSPEETALRFPSVRREGLLGGAVWNDGLMTEPERLLMEMLRWAAACGAGALNYVEAHRLLVENGAVAGLEASDRESGETFALRAPAVINCAGPWCREAARRLDRDLAGLHPPSVAFNLLLDRKPPSADALALTPRSPGARTYFLLPWNGRVFAGTFHAAWRGTLDGDPVDDRLLRAFLDDLNSAHPPLALDRDAVLRVCWGFLPAAREGGEEQAVRDVIAHHADHGGPEGLFSISGVKHTTARLVAEKTLRRLHAWRGLPLPRVAGPSRPDLQEVPDLVRAEALLREDPGTLARGIRSLVQDESVVRLDDLLLRRTDWGFEPSRGLEIGRKVAGLIGWDPERAEAELASLCRAAA